jgi:hypothetical protein
MPLAGCDPRECIRDMVEHALPVVDQLGAWDAEYLEPSCVHVAVPGGVRSLGHPVLLAIDFDHYLRMVADEVRHVGTDRDLLAKVIATGAKWMEQKPHPDLGLARPFPELLGTCGHRGVPSLA